MENFSEVAEAYDKDFTFSPIGIYQRKSIWKYLLKYFEGKSKSVLEVNCGTGIDAFIMKHLGCEVIATDVSEEMIAVAKTNASKNNFILAELVNTPAHKNQTEIIFHTSDFQSIKQIVADKKFDMVFSNFGGLNCIDKNQLQQVFQDFYTVLNENGKLIIVMLAPNCIWEKLYFKLKGEAQKVNRRQNKNGAETVIENKHFKTYYFQTQEIENIAENKFKVIEQKPIGLFIPPSYLNKFFNNKKITLQILNVLDSIFSFSFLSNHADHYLMVLQKNSST